MTLALKDGDRYLFMGDSITDAGRRDTPSGLGNGYAAIVPGLVAAKAPGLQVDWMNRGISGNTLLELEERWEEDCLALEPTWMSMLIGINDLHRHLFFEDEDRLRCSPAQYAERYEKLLSQVREACGTKFILLEPFYFTAPPGEGDNQRAVLEIIPEYLQVVHDLAAKFEAKLVRTHEWGQEIIAQRGSALLCAEPVHPNLTGHAAMASWVLKALKE